MYIVVVALACCMMLVAAHIFAHREAAKARLCGGLRAEDIAGLDADSYRPMGRLLGAADLDLVRMSSLDLRRFRAQRYAEFAGYLSNLRAGYTQASRLLLCVALGSDVDGPATFVVLVRNCTVFGISVMAARIGAVLYRFGLTTVDGRGLVYQFDGMITAVRAAYARSSSTPATRASTATLRPAPRT